MSGYKVDTIKIELNVLSCLIKPADFVVLFNNSVMIFVQSTVSSVLCFWLRSNTNVNDALGDYSLTLVDSLDTLVIMGNATEFRRAAQLVVDHVMFDRCTTVQVFEATIRYVHVIPYCTQLSADMVLVYIVFHKFLDAA